MDRPDSLRMFIAVADKGSFTEAARSLNVSGTAATRAVSSLEAALGVTLFMRTTRSVRLMVNSADAAVAAVCSGLGIARTLFCQVAQEIATGKLQRLLIDLELPLMPVNLVFQGSRRRSPNLRPFLEAAREHVAKGIG